MNNNSNNCGDCGTTCSECGRPWAICKQDGGCGCNKCKDIKFCEYGRMANGCIREKQPGCPMQAVIPSVTVESIEGIKNLADCLVHVSDINTTFYIDDKHRPIITWAGPIDIPGYDMEGNPNNYRDQIVTDTANQEAVIYDKSGRGYVFGLVENIDLQDQIDNKLDEMVTDGTLNTIINQEIFGDINTRLDLLDQKKYIFIGDSYCEGWTPDGNVESWAVNLKRKLGLTDANCTIAYHGGYGFANVSQSFSSILNSLTPDSDVTDIVVCGGYNDLTGTYLQIFTGVQNFIGVARNKFPNAKIHVGFIGFSDNPSQRNNIRNTCRYYREISTLFPESSYLSNVEYSLKNVYKVFASDGIHPNTNGQESIAINLKNALASGSADTGHGYLAMNITPDVLWDGTNENLNSFGTSFVNGLTTIECVGANKIIVKSSTGISEWSGNMSWKKIGDITDGHIVGNNFSSIVIPVSLVLGYYDGWVKYKSVQGLVRFENKEMSVCYLEANANGYVTTNAVREIQIGKFSGSFNSLFC